MRTPAIPALIATAILTTLALHASPAAAQNGPADPGRRACGPGAREISVTEFGAHADSPDDSTGAFRDALSYAARCSVPTLRIPAGHFRFIVQNPSNGLLIGSNLRLQGEGRGVSVLEVDSARSGANLASLFWIRNQDNVEIKGLSFVGSNARVNGKDGRPLVTYGAAVTIALDEHRLSDETGEPRDLSRFVIRDSSFENFCAGAWISVINYNASHSIRDVKIIDNQFISRDQDTINGRLITHPAAAISVMGSLTNPEAVVSDVLIARNRFEAKYIKSGVNIWSGVRSVRIVDNQILDAGTSDAISDDAGAYAINVYHNAYYHGGAHAAGESMGGIRPDDIHIERNALVNPRSCGVYSAGADHIWIEENTVSGQTDPRNGTLPKGAIALNQPLNAIVRNNKIRASHIGMDLYEGAGGRISEDGNEIEDVPRNGFGKYSRVLRR